LDFCSPRGDGGAKAGFPKSRSFCVLKEYAADASASDPCRKQADITGDQFCFEIARTHVTRTAG
jgi:hypothetical protein